MAYEDLLRKMNQYLHANMYTNQMGTTFPFNLLQLALEDILTE